MELKCPYFNLCGGCNKLNLTYEEEIKEKEEYPRQNERSDGNKRCSGGHQDLLHR